MNCKCNSPDPLLCQECEESTGVCDCKCHGEELNREERRPKHIDFLVLSIPTRLLKVKELPSGKDVIRAINSMYGKKGKLNGRTANK